MLLRIHMRRLFSYAILLLVVVHIDGFSQSPSNAPKGFLTIDWGESPEAARVKLLTRAGVVFDSGYVDPSHQRLLFKAGTFMGEPVDTWSLEFVNNKFFWAYVLLDSENFGDVESLLRVKYGTPTSKTDTMIEWQFPEASVRFIPGAPPGHTGVAIWNTKLYRTKTKHYEKTRKEKLNDHLRDLD